MSFFDFLRSLFSASSSTTEQPAADWIVIGLGNPGPRYQSTRHNVGYLGVDALLNGTALVQRKGLPVQEARIRIGDQEVSVLRSTTYMNNSGEAIVPIMAENGLSPENVIILHDELDLPQGKIRLKKGGNENGHNGLKSATALLGTRDYLRVRMGISRPPQGVKVADYVLSPVEDAAVMSMSHTAAEAVKIIISEGLVAAQNKIHSRS
ncbi:Peptidyl-tRNA hydrolase 2 [Corynebacterium kutscheri]|uniref:Peptidyl-tRNA hydrolase n=1 Tax=Corynebacterium kutscheri TaxID=35755 RepID=A0A0F6R0L0_9CORY|nr:aminoacyl-tRNA hydrolase [Corynebacterium kutscheri]AKE41807.1 aminoacyl-tRNA hydrolase [Corynebacterium kutscheri]VEH09084.1 Peptidyl-tRNA hydrolase 2 [Corynebacterium kutscheri]VEH10135.1 Peptidyl-tRNA hydrolase 2 [Corynebacterium kutscheri]VEH80217.1 Peptidyl-tRNA hydrolase 2 [Corynebacterium kutscheri]